MKRSLFLIALLATGTPAFAAGRGAALTRELNSAMAQAAKALLVAPINVGVQNFATLRLMPHTKLQLVDQTNGYYKGTGLRTATADFAGAKAALDTAVKHHEPIDGSVAATFLARYAWFRADYAAVNRFPNAEYPMRRFRKLVRQALAFDPKNSQALLMWYFYQYCAHSHLRYVQMPEKPPHAPFTQVFFTFPAEWKKRLINDLGALVKAYPKDFEAWVFLGDLHASGSPRATLGMMRSAKFADAFYLSSRRREVATYVAWGEKFLRKYPKYYEEYYGHPPPRTRKK